MGNRHSWVGGAIKNKAKTSEPGLLPNQEEWQVQFQAQFLWVALALCVFLFVRDLLVGMNAVLSGIGVSLVLLTITGMRRRPDWGPSLGVLFLTAGGVLGGLAGLEEASASTPILCMSVLPGTLSTLLAGPLIGGVVSLLMLAMMLGLVWAFPLVELVDVNRFTNELIVMMVCYFVAWATDAGFKRLQGVVAERAQELEKAHAQAQSLAAAMFQDLGPLLAEMKLTLNSGPKAVMPVVARLRVRLARAREEFGHEAKSHPQEQGQDEMGVPLAKVIIACFFGSALLFLIRNSLWDGPLLLNLVPLVLMPLVYWGLHKAPRHVTPFRVGLFATALGLVMNWVAFKTWGANSASPNLVLLPMLIVIGSLLNGHWLYLVIFAFSLFELAMASRNISPGHAGKHLLLNLGVLQAILGFLIYGLIRSRQRFLKRLHLRGLALREAMRLRRRLAGTLFHDVSNQLMALGYNLQLGSEAEPDLDAQTTRRLFARIEALIHGAQGFMAGEQALDKSQLKPVAVQALFQDMQALFRANLQAKQQVLSLEAGGGLKMLGVPEFLTESVLGNLVSNAIKFSPMGAVIELRAKLEGDQVALSVLDQGPGIPEAYVKTLQEDGPLPSRPGSQGELGQGFGLKLVQEHLSRQGGQLQLSRREGGGTEAVVKLAQG